MWSWGWNRIGLVPCGRLEQSGAGELGELGLEQVLKDPGLRHKRERKLG